MAIEFNWMATENISFTDNVYTHIEMIAWFFSTIYRGHHDPYLALRMGVQDLEIYTQNI